VRLTDDRDDPQAARARRRRRAITAVFLAGAAAALFGLLYAAQRLAVSYPADDPQAWIEAARADGVWQFRVGPMAEWLEGTAAEGEARGEFRTLGRGIHPEGALFVYGDGGDDLDWLAVLSVKRPLKMYHEPVDALVRDLSEDSSAEVVVVRDGRRMLVASDEARIEAFRARLAPREMPKGASTTGPALSFRGRAAVVPAAWREAMGAAFDGAAEMIGSDQSEIALLWPSPEPGPLCAVTVTTPAGFPREALDRAAAATGAKIAMGGDGRATMTVLAQNVPPVWNPENPVALVMPTEGGARP